MRVPGAGVALALLVAVAGAAPAAAQFPFPARLPAGQTPNDLTGSLMWKLAATPEARDALNAPVLDDPGEVHGVRGASVVDADPHASTAWMRTTGRPDVTLAVLDSGIRWDEAGAMSDLRRKVRLDTAELPAPRRDRTTALGTGTPCSSYRGHGDDLDGDGVVTVDDWACDRRVSLTDPRRAGPPGVLTPQDLIVAFSDGRDDDGNGYVDDIAGWDFLDDDNDPYDDVHYGHGTGEAEDSTAEANNGGALGTCPNCTVLPLRVGDSFVADANRFGAAALYATDNGAAVIQEALGTFDNTRLSREAVDYAYRHGVPVIASAADEAAQHHNWPSSLPHTIVVNSVRQYDSTLTPRPRSYLQVNGCTNFSSKITLAVPSTSCSSEATGRASGMAGLVVSAARIAHDRGLLAYHPSCRHADGARCVLSANEVRQVLIAAADDVWFTGPGAEPSCATRAPGCTDPSRYVWPIVRAHRPVTGLVPSSSYPARRGDDQFTGYGRIDAARAVAALLPDSGRAAVPPEVEITSPDWYAPVDPRRAYAPIGAQVDARGVAYRCQVLVAPGSYPNDAAAPVGDFVPVPSPWCDGRTLHRRAFDGTVAQLDIRALRVRFPADAGSFDGPLPPAGSQLANGRPNSEPYGFVVKVVATSGGRVGQDRRNLYLHRDRDLLRGFPRGSAGDGGVQSSPVLADLDGDGSGELVYATDDGVVHAVRPSGRELPGFPVRTPAIGFLHPGRAVRSGAVGRRVSAPVVSALAAADLNGDGRLELLAADFEGGVTGWDARGRRVFSAHTDLRFSGRPLRPFVPARHGAQDRTQRGFLSAPVVADLDGDGRPEIVAAAMDRHVYAWHANGRPVRGFPTLVVDRSKVASVDPVTDQVTFKPGAGADLDQGAIVDTPAVGDLTGDGRPEIVVGTNEEYDAAQDGGPNAAGLTSGTLGALVSAGVLHLANSRVYALRGDGTVLPGWPFKLTTVNAELLPVVGEGVTGSPVIGRVACPHGGTGPKVGVMPDTGPALVLNPDGTSCYGGAGGLPIPLALAGGANAQAHDFPAIPTLGQPAFAHLGGDTALLAPAAGLTRALDLQAPEYQGGQDLIGAWNGSTGTLRSGFPGAVDDLSFLTGPIAADLDGRGGDDVLGGTAYLDLYAFSGGTGAPVAGFPKLTTDWLVGEPVVGTFGRRRRIVAAGTRSGLVLAWRTAARACAGASWPRFHHDPANSGTLERDATPPGPVRVLRATRRALVVVAPGDDGACGRAARWSVLLSRRRPAAGQPPPLRAAHEVHAQVGAARRQRLVLPPGAWRWAVVRAIDDAGNAGPATLVRLRGARTR